jgi:hypothetical protein
MKVGDYWQFDFARLLYQGGASANINVAAEHLEERFGAPDGRRLPLVQKIADVIEARVRAGGSRLSAKTVIDKIRVLYTWADEQALTLTFENARSSFLRWSDHLATRVRIGDIKRDTAYGVVAIVAGVLDEVLDLEVGLIRQTRHRRRYREKVAGYRPVDLEKTILLGQTLCDICEALTVDAIRGDLPVQIKFKSGQTINHWSGLRGIEIEVPLSAGESKNSQSNKKWAANRDPSNRTRQSLINLRIQSEMLIFIAQTGMNLAQTKRLSLGRFSYQSHSGGYLIRRVYKQRRQGEVEFEIYAEYRPFLERYLDWLKEIFPDDENSLVFPFIPARSSQGRSLNGVCENLKAIRSVLKKLDVHFLTPRQLRKARINWLARRSGDINQTAEMAQTSKEVLFRNYLVPDPQIAAVEISKFFQKQHESAYSSPGPGICIDPEPSQILSSPSQAPAPDCISPSGCMFCSHQRDIDSLDHVWSLASYRYLKTMELATYRSTSIEIEHPASVVIDRVTEKIKFFEGSSLNRREWVAAANDKVREGDYHPMWAGFIELMEVLL